MQDIQRSAFFLETARGGRFFLVTEPAREPRGTLLFVPPFAEELNKTRRMTALAARQFASAGWRVVQFDLFGTGDSWGDFGDAAWADWLDDMDSAVAWCRQDTRAEPVLWSLRAGALLASAWQARSGACLAQFMWQPVVNGRQHLMQFVRVKMAAGITGGGGGPGRLDEPSVEVSVRRQFAGGCWLHPFADLGGWSWGRQVRTERPRAGCGP